MESNKMLFDDIEYLAPLIKFCESKNCPVIGPNPFLTKEELSGVTEEHMRNNKVLQKMYLYKWHKGSAFYKRVLELWKFPNEPPLSLTNKIKEENVTMKENLDIEENVFKNENEVNVENESMYENITMEENMDVEENVFKNENDVNVENEGMEDNMTMEENLDIEENVFKTEIEIEVENEAMEETLIKEYEVYEFVLNKYKGTEENIIILKFVPIEEYIASVDEKFIDYCKTNIFNQPFYTIETMEWAHQNSKESIIFIHSLIYTGDK